MRDSRYLRTGSSASPMLNLSSSLKESGISNNNNATTSEEKRHHHRQVDEDAASRAEEDESGEDEPVPSPRPHHHHALVHHVAMRRNEPVDDSDVNDDEEDEDEGKRGMAFNPFASTTNRATSRSVCIIDSEQTPVTKWREMDRLAHATATKITQRRRQQLRPLLPRFRQQPLRPSTTLPSSTHP